MRKPIILLKRVRRFARHDLTAHMRMHKGEKPFSCNSCDRKFTTSGQLNQHIRMHTGEQQFECKVCSKTCSSASYLKKHLLAHINAPIVTPAIEATLNASPKTSSKFPSSIPALSSNPSTFYAINEMSGATIDAKKQSPVVNKDRGDATPNNGKEIYQAIDPSIFRIQQVRSVGLPIIGQTDTHYDTSDDETLIPSKS